MFRISVLALTVLLCIVSLSCQQYSTGLQRSVARADETAAVGALRAIAAAQQGYALTTGGDFGTFQQLCEGGFLDSRFNSSKPSVRDYVLSMEVKPKSASDTVGFFSCNADPVAGAQAGRHFYIDSTSSDLRVNPSQAATAKDPVLQP